MRSRFIGLVSFFALVLLTLSPLKAQEQSARIKELQILMELAVDQFQLNRIIESRAALNRILAQKITDEEAFELRRIFGEKIIFQMQKYGDRPALNAAERQALMYLGEAGYALDLNNREKSLDRMKKLQEVFTKNGYGKESFEMMRAADLVSELEAADKDDAKALARVNLRVAAWKEELQSVGNAPLVILSRAQRYEQSKLRSPQMIASLVENVVKSPQNAQLNLLEIDRLGIYAVPELVKYLQDDKNNAISANAQFVLLSLGEVTTLPLCEALKSTNQVLVQHVCNILGMMKPSDQRAVPFVKAVQENGENLPSTRDAAAAALKSITGKDVSQLMTASDYFLAEANRYYLGGTAVDHEILTLNGTYWAWSQPAGKKSGELKEIKVPAFILADFIAEELAYRSLALAQNKVPGQVLLAGIMLQEKNRVDIVNKLLRREDMSLPGIEQMRADAVVWSKRLYRNYRAAYALGADYLAATLEKALVDEKPEIAILAIEGLAEVTGKDGWNKLSALTFGDKKSSGNAPLLQALDNKNERVASSAAIALVTMGMPATDANYQKLLPVLVRGSQENQATIALLISNSLKLRNRLSSSLEKSGIIMIQSGDGYGGYALATKYPPKDAILIDNKIDQFDALRLQLELRKVSHAKTLPLVIITSRDHATAIATQFSGDEINKAAEKLQVTAQDVVNNQNNNFENRQWQVTVRHNVKVDNGGVYEDLVSMGQNSSEKQNVVILTCPTREERYKLKEELMVKAERSLRPQGLTEYSRLKNEQRVLGDIFGVRSTYVPVFVDEEISGYDAMKTVLSLQTDPRTRPVPVAILADKEMMDYVNKDFEFFIKDKMVRVFDSSISGQELAAKINEMKKENALSSQNYARDLSDDIAGRSCLALAQLSTGAFAAGLNQEEQKALTEIIADQTRPVELRIAAAQALGHFKATLAVARLVTLFDNLSKEEVALRKAVLGAIGAIDTENKYLDFKLKAMNEDNEEIQAQAAMILGPAAQNPAEVSKYLKQLRPNDPLVLSEQEGGDAVKSEAPQENKEEKKEAAKEESKEEKKEAVKEEKKEGGKKKGADTGFDW